VYLLNRAFKLLTINNLFRPEIASVDDKLLKGYALVVYTIMVLTPGGMLARISGSILRTERWSRNTLRVLIARVYYVLKGVFNVLVYFNNSVETAWYIF